MGYNYKMEMGRVNPNLNGCEIMAKELEASTKQLYIKIANMQLMNVAATAIAEVIGVTEGAISQLVVKAEYLEIKQALLATRYSEQQELDEGWDGIERKAVKVVGDALAWNADPEFALRAAALANKSVRRGKSVGNEVLPGMVGQRVHISLSQTFINRLNHVKGDDVAEEGVAAAPPVIEHKVNAGEPIKQHNSLSAKSVKKLFGAEEEEAKSSRDFVQDTVNHLFAMPALLGNA